jgi:urea transport system ATP-binding protein
MLNVKNINQYYGGSHILRDVSLQAHQGKVTVLLGRNGVGKTTLLKSLMGLVPIKTGTIEFDGKPLQAATPYERVRAGIGFVPQGREIFARLTVEENLRMGLAYKPGSTPIPAELYELFPVLKQMLHRRGGDLSGGQQQQLAIARALAAGPKLLILDEPTEGIQPSIIKDISGGRFANINRPIAGPRTTRSCRSGKHPLAALLAGHAQRREGHGHARGTAGAGPRRRRIRRLADPHRRGRAVRQRLREVNPNSKIPALLDRSGPDADPGVRIGRDPDVPGREVRRLPAQRAARARRVPVVAVLADGQRALPGRRLRAFLCLCADQDRIRDRPLRDGSQAPARRARPPPGRQRIHGRQTSTRSPTWRSGPGTARWPRG